MYAVVVTFQIKAGAMNGFMPLMTENAKASLANESDCHRFDVCTDSERNDEVFLYELYTDRAAFEAHLASAHFQEFDAKASGMMASKTIKTYDKVTA